jgi:ribosome modulation factor
MNKHLFRNEALPMRLDGKPHTNKDFLLQGYSAGQYGIDIKDCPYYKTSIAEKWWKKGHRGDLK